MYFMEKEIREEPQKLLEAYRMNLEKIEYIASEFKLRNIRHVVLAARGSSDHAGVYFKYLMEILVGIPVSLSAPSVITAYHGQLDLSDTMTIGISQSGQAEDVMAVVSRAKAMNALTVSVTNDPGSPLAKMAKYHLDQCAGKEKSVAATKTFTAEMYLLALLVERISQNKKLKEELDDLPRLMDETMSLDSKITTMAKSFKTIGSCFVIGRGLNDAIALEIALKLQETSYIQAFGYATSDFCHGPFALVEEGSVALLLAPEDETFPDSENITKRLYKAGAMIVALTDDEGLDVKDKIVLPKSGEYVKPFLFTMAGQLLALRVSEAKGIDPDHPRNLKKITITK